MECCSLIRKDRVGDLESQGPKNDGTDHGRYFHWDVMFLVVCVAAVSTDPFFFYLPVINEASKCILIDNTLKIIAICIRSFLDVVAFGDLVKRKRNKCPHFKRADYVINILSILPIHQVLMPIIFSEMRGSKIPHIVKFLNTVVLLQFLPRIFRIYRLWKIVNETIILPKNGPDTGDNVKNPDDNPIRLKRFIVMKGGFNFFLYLVASHALGAFWYFFSIERETKCWQLAACKHDIGCIKSISLTCGSTHGFRNYTILNDSCSIKKPNTAQLFDFGIFENAIQSGVLTSMDFPRKMLFCFWWGLRNLSSFGQNLQTTPYYWENCFTVLISMIGLILFLYFIGNLQVYMQQDASDELERLKANQSKTSQLKKSIPDTKLRIASDVFLDSIKDWINTIGLPDELKEKIMISHVTPQLEHLRRSIKLDVCVHLLRRVPMFKYASEELLSEITDKYLKRVQYDENDFIVQEGKPLEDMIFVLKGHVCRCPEKYELIGEQLVNWVMESPGQSNPPLSPSSFKCHTKVEALCLTARDLTQFKSEHASHSSNRNS